MHGVAACHRCGVCTVRCVECMVWQHVIGMVCGVCTVGCVECMGWQYVIGTVCVLCAVLSAWSASMC